MKKKYFSVLLAAVVLAACGGGGGDGGSSNGAGTSAGTGAGTGEGGKNDPTPSIPVEQGGKSVGPGAGRGLIDDDGNEVVLGERSYLLAKAQKESALLDRSVKTLTIPRIAGQQYAEGDVLITEAFGGLLARVTAVRQESINTVYVFEYATLAEAFEVFKVNFDNEINQAIQGQGTYVSADGVTISQRPSSEFSPSNLPVVARKMAMKSGVEDSDSVAEKKGLYFQLSNFSMGEAVLNGGFFLSLDPKINFNLERVKPTSEFAGFPNFRLDGALNPQFHTALRLKIPNGSSFQHEVPIFKSQYKPFEKNLWIPIPYQPYLDVALKVNAAGGAKYELQNSINIAGNIRANVSSSEMPSGNITFGKYLTNIDVVGAEAGLKGSLALPSVSAGVMLYNAVGAHLNVDSEHNVEVKETISPWVNIPMRLIGLNAQVKATVGFKLGEAIKLPFFALKFFNLENWAKNFFADSVANVINAKIEDKLTFKYFEKEYSEYEPTLLAGGGAHSIGMYIDGTYVADLVNHSGNAKPYVWNKPSVGVHKIKLVYQRCIPSMYTDCKYPPTAEYSFRLYSSENMRLEHPSFGNDGTMSGKNGYLISVGDSATFTLTVKPTGEKFVSCQGPDDCARS